MCGISYLHISFLIIFIQTAFNSYIKICQMTNIFFYPNKCISTTKKEKYNKTEPAFGINIMYILMKWIKIDDKSLNDGFVFPILYIFHVCGTMINENIYISFVFIHHRNELMKILILWDYSSISEPISQCNIMFLLGL